MGKFGRQRRGTALLAATITFFSGGRALADEPQQCASAADQAQQLRDEGKYRRAREQLLVCARDTCPGLIKRDCVEWLTQLDTIAPTIVFAAREGDKDLTDVKVSMDGAPVLDHLDGKPIPVDAGKHVFRFEHGSAVKEQEVVVNAGQKGRNITVSFAGPGAEVVKNHDDESLGKASSASAGSPVPAYVVGAIGVVALGSFALFGIQGKNEVDDLEKCKPSCAESDVYKARTKLIIADVSLGVGVVALGVATYMFLTRPKSEPRATVDAKSGRRAGPLDHGRGLGIGIGPISGGVAAAFGGRF